MKKYLSIFTTVIAFFVLTIDSNAQAFQKGNANLDVGIGFGGYSTTATITANVPFFGNLTISNEDGAASVIAPITFEYGISNKVGLGVQLGFSNYFIDNEDSTETTESVKSVDFAILVNYHLLNSDKNDLFIGIALGGSSVNWKDLSGEEWTGAGSYFSLYIKDRIFFNDNVGILFNLGYTGYRYSQLESSIDNPWITKFEWTVRGVNFGTGLALKF